MQGSVATAVCGLGISARVIERRVLIRGRHSSQPTSKLGAVAPHRDANPKFRSSRCTRRLHAKRADQTTRDIAAQHDFPMHIGLHQAARVRAGELRRLVDERRTKQVAPSIVDHSSANNLRTVVLGNGRCYRIAILQRHEQETERRNHLLENWCALFTRSSSLIVGLSGCRRQWMQRMLDECLGRSMIAHIVLRAMKRSPVRERVVTRINGGRGERLTQSSRRAPLAALAVTLSAACSGASSSQPPRATAPTQIPFGRQQIRCSVAISVRPYGLPRIALPPARNSETSPLPMPASSR